MTDAEKEAIIANALKHQGGMEKLREAGAEVIRELHDRLRAEGWSDAEVQFMHSFMMSRRPLRNYSEIARKLIDIQPLPAGAVPIYDREPPKEDT